MHHWFAWMAVGCVCLSTGTGIARGDDAAERTSPQFVERPGILEFSGQMIVRPMQPAALAARGLEQDDIATIRTRAGGRLAKHVLEYVEKTDEYIVTLPAGETEDSFAARLMATGDYQYAVPNWFCHPAETVPNDPEYWRQWCHTTMQSPLAWDCVTGDADLIVAIVDGGIELDHPDLAAALVSGYNSKDHLAQADGGDVSDIHGGHGTFVAGIAAGIGNNGSHVAGVGWDFSIMPVRYTNDPGGGLLGDILDGARWAVDHGARCVNVSQTGVEYSPVQTTGEYVRSQGGLLLWAAGNDGRDLSWFDWPDVIVVGASDSDDNRPDWSAYGLAVDVFAPGNEIISIALNGGLGIGSGTSAAAPMATGLCGLIWAVRPDLVPDEVEQYLFGGCADLGAPGNDDIWGWGRISSASSVYDVCFDFGSDCNANGIPDACEWPRPCPGDVDSDCDVDLADLARLLGNYGMTGARYEDGDVSGDETIDIVDLALLLADYGTTCP